MTLWASGGTASAANSAVAHIPSASRLSLKYVCRS